MYQEHMIANLTKMTLIKFRIEPFKTEIEWSAIFLIGDFFSFKPGSSVPPSHFLFSIFISDNNRPSKLNYLK